MARNGVQITGGTGIVGKLKGLVALVLLVVFIVTNPAGAADAAVMLGHGVMTVADGLGAFVTALSGGAR